MRVVCPFIRETCVRLCMHAFVCACMCVCVCMRACVLACVQCVCAYVGRMCVRAYVRACVHVVTVEVESVWSSVFSSTCVHACKCVISVGLTREVRVLPCKLHMYWLMWGFLIRSIMKC